MAFGASKGFRGGKGKNGQSSRPQYRDKLCIVTGYDLESNVIKCIDVEDGKTIVAHVDPEAVARNVISEEKNPNASFFGHRIDSRMQKNIPEKHRIVLERAEFVRKLTKDGVETQIYKCQRVHHIKDMLASKSFTGILTMNAWDNRVQNIQNWEEASINGENPESIEALAKRLDEVNEEYAKAQAELGEEGRPAIPQIGVQFRTFIPGENPNEVVGVDFSVPKDYVRAEKDGQGNIITPGHIYDRESFLEDVQGYTEYSRELFPDAKIEINVYTNYRASGRSEAFDLTDRRPFDSMVVMTNTATKLALADEEPEIGRNWACRGIVVLASDKVGQREDGSFSVEKRNMVNRAFVNSTWKGNINAFIRTSDGKKLTIHPDLRRQLNNDGAQKAPEENGAPSSAQNAPSSSSAPQPGANLGGVGADPWEEDGSGDLPMDVSAPPVQEAAPASAPESSEPAASAPVEQPSAPPVEETPGDKLAAASKKLGGARF